MGAEAAMVCELCVGPGGTLLWQDARCRVVAVEDPDYPGFCRVIWQAHARELTDLAPADRDHLMTVVWATESAVRRVTGAHKINLASLGNLCPHVHWHVIPRNRDDAHFPQPIWGQRQRDPLPASQALRERWRAAVGQGLAEVLGPLPPPEAPRP